ncbi:MAG: hypothetical protein R3F43_02790 [bacterium]
MEKFIIEGRQPLAGSVTPSGSKNEVLPCLAAALLTDDPVILGNVPRIRDVLVMCEVLEHQGATVEWIGENRVRIVASAVGAHHPQRRPVPQGARPSCSRGRWWRGWGGWCCRRRGGDVIGRRRLDTHFHAFEALGATVEVSDVYDIQASSLTGADIFLDEASVTATENAIMVAALARGTTILRNAASEPHVCALARMPGGHGAHIDGIGTNTLRIEGVERLGGVEHEVESDYLEIGSLIGLAAVTRSELTINKVRPTDLA